ncbi:hypothetical protein D1013_19075 [Euzebyella marina]|uniref:DUF4292 domain-containing protein n=1 Tax=Euzebyella marina TaxID=1761453 RepID=A0A3G2LAR5_9FLAO|nr:hypothetical protein D1013_19075 [Euzebyella marina]
MRIFLSSICFLLIFGCASYPKKNNFKVVTKETPPQNVLNPYFSNPDKDYVYKANIDALGNKIGGLFIIKKLGEKTHRILFTTEMGNTLFDFSFQQNGFTVNRILKELDKKILINILKRDLKALVLEKPAVEQVFSKTNNRLIETNILSKKHYFYFDSEDLKDIVRTRNGKVIVKHHFANIENDFAGQINITHENIQLKITLTALP